MTDGLSRKHRAFVSEYLVDLNQTQAAIRAGYAPGCASVTATRLIADAKIAAAVHEAFMERSIRTEIDQDFVLDRLRIEALGDGEDTSSGARIKATELLGKHLGMFTEKHQIESVGPPPVIQFLPAIRRASDDDSDR